MNYNAKILPVTGGIVAGGFLGLWLPVLIIVGLCILLALGIRLLKPIKR